MWGHEGSTKWFLLRKCLSGLPGNDHFNHRDKIPVTLIDKG